MPADINSYLATHYLTADAKPSSKKRKRKHDVGLLIKDDDDSWATTKPSSSSRHHGHGDGDDDDGPLTVGAIKEARMLTTRNNWTKATMIGHTTLSSTTTTEDKDSAAAADAILATAASEAAALQAEDDAAPMIAGGGTSKDVARSTQPPAPLSIAEPLKMGDGTHAGLQTAAAVSAQYALRKNEERERYAAEQRALALQPSSSTNPSTKAGDQDDQIIYRDATGRRIDVSAKRAEARRAILEAEKRERDAKDALKGEVQMEAARQRREELEEAKTMTLARGEDDEEMNRELRGVRRWNDPMARFLEGDGEDGGGGAVATVKGGGGGGGYGNKGKPAAARRPVYKGPAAPNRYGIKPGYRWDGVDRGIGFEAERFKAINRRERNKGLEYSWQMDE